MADCDAAGARSGESVMLQPGEGRVISLGDAGDVTLKVVGAQSGGTMAAYDFVSPPRTAGPPLHLHRNWDEAFYVLDGEMTFLIAGETHTAPAGSFVFIPRGIEHTFWNASDAPTRQLTVFTPAGIEDYFAEVAEVMAAGGENTLAAAIALMEKHDMVVPPSSRQAYGAFASPDTR